MNDRDNDEALISAQRKWGGDIVDGRLVPSEARRSAQDAGFERLWYVLLIQPLHEDKAAAHLVGRRFQIYSPTVPTITTRGVKRTKVTVQRPMFRGYLFVKLHFRHDERRLHHVRAAPGVHNFLRLDDQYAVVPPHEMSRIGALEKDFQDHKLAAQGEVTYVVGETVRVKEGPFWGLNATVEACNGERITVSLALLGRAVPVTMSADEIEKL